MSSGRAPDLRNALRECRELLALTEKLIQRTYHLGAPPADGPAAPEPDVQSRHRPEDKS